MFLRSCLSSQPTVLQCYLQELNDFTCFSILYFQVTFSEIFKLNCICCLGHTLSSLTFLKLCFLYFKLGWRAISRSFHGNLLKCPWIHHAFLKCPTTVKTGKLQLLIADFLNNTANHFKLCIYCYFYKVIVANAFLWMS